MKFFLKMKEENTNTRNKTPGMSNLPLIGWLFQNKDTTKKKTELAIFLTPHIITGDFDRLDDASTQGQTGNAELTKKIKDRLD